MAKFDSDIHHRRSIRVPGYDYSGAGAYFLTIVACDRLCLFGEVKHGQVELSDAGKMLQQQWAALPARFSTVQLDEFIVMPNHVHDIMWIVEGGETEASGAQPIRMDDASKRAGTSPAPTGLGKTRSAVPTLGAIVGAWKSITTVEYIRGVRQFDWDPFRRTLWQRNYWEHIVRDEPELSRIRGYIFGNPTNWEVDEENPLRKTDDRSNTNASVQAMHSRERRPLQWN